MAQGHMDRLTAVDASFLTNEGSASHMHIGGVLIFDGPAPAYEDLLEHVNARLAMVPRYRQKLATPPIETGRPFWVDDPQFNIEYHVRHSSLPSPGSEDQLRLMAARVFSQQLDRTKPLWELWLVQGLKKKRFAMISKTHHSVVDGVSGVDIGTVLFDVKPNPQPASPDRDWIPRPEPSPATLAVRGIGGLAKTPLRIARRSVRAARDPGTTITKLSEAAAGVGEIAWAFANPSPDTPLNVPIGSHRRYVWVRSDLADLKRIKDRFGGTVNDVVLSVVAGGLRRWLQSRGVRTEGMELRALVPVSIRGSDSRGELGNQIAAMRGPLPVYVADPVQRLAVVSEDMAAIKSSGQALGAEMISRLNDFAPPTLLAQASRINFSTRLFNLIVTNVPGPQFPLYVLGRELRDIFPVAFLPANHALAIAIMSYNGKIDFGLLADYDAMADVGEVATGIEAEIAELLVAAGSEEDDVGEALDSEPADGATAETTG